MGKLSRRVAIVGAGMSQFGKLFPLKRNPDLWVDSWLNAVKTVDNGIEPKNIDDLPVVGVGATDSPRGPSPRCWLAAPR